MSFNELRHATPTAPHTHTRTDCKSLCVPPMGFSVYLDNVNMCLSIYESVSNYRVALFPHGIPNAEAYNG